MKIRIAVISILLVSAVLIVFGNVGHFDFIRYDDEVYITKNSHVLSGLTVGSLRWALTTLDEGFWHPLTWLSLMLDRELYGLNAGGYHWTNVILHLLSGLLLFFTFFRMTGAIWRSGCVAALFLLHPLHVEPAAWVAVRKDVLSAFFWMAGMWAYARYAEKPAVGRYLWVVLFFFMGLMSKPMAVTLPFVLLLLDYWPLQRWKPDSPDWKMGIVRNAGKDGIERISFSKASTLTLIIEKIPLLFLSLATSVIAWIAEKGAGSLSTLDAVPLSLRLDNAIVSYARYLAKTIWPAQLSFFYPHPGHWPAWQVSASGAILILISLWVFLRWKKDRYLPVGWLWFLGTLIPVIGLVQVGSHAMADRYAYIPLIGLSIMVVWGSDRILQQSRLHTRMLPIVWVTALLALTVCGWRQVQYWRDSMSLFSHAIEVTQRNHLAHNNLGAVLMDKRNYRLAEDHLLIALQIKPDFAAALNNMGKIQAFYGENESAANSFRKALAAEPHYRGAKRNLADLLLLMGKADDSITLYREILSMNVDDPELFNNYGVALFRSGLRDEATIQIRKALLLRPDYAAAQDNLRKIQEAE